MAEKDNKTKLPVDYRKVDQPIVDSIFWNPNDLNEALNNLDDYESWSNTDNVFNNPKGGKAVVEKHEVYDDADKAKIVKKTIKKAVLNTLAADKEEIPNTITKKVDNILSNEDKLEEILKDYDAYEEYLGLGPVELTNEKVNTKEFPMNDTFANNAIDKTTKKKL